MLSKILEILNNKVENRYYGKYRAQVTNTMDPLQSGRIMVKVPALMGDVEIGWALPCFPYGGGTNRGYFMLPEVDDCVWVEFEGGMLSYPIWSGAWWGTGDAPKSSKGAPADSAIKIIRSKQGNIIELNDTVGGEAISIIDKTGNKIIMDSKGISIEVTTADVKVKGMSVKIEATSELSLKGATVKLEATGTVSIKGAQVNLNE